MRQWWLYLTLTVLSLSSLLTVPARAQSELTLTYLEVQLWPEYDQPTMLVINDFELPAGTEYPASLTFHIPREANLIAVAYKQADGMLDTPYDGPVVQGNWQAFTVVVNTQTTYHFEYYQPLDISGETRRYSYLWDGAYAVDRFSIRVLQPVDMVSITAEPELETGRALDGSTIYTGDPEKLAAGQQYSLRLVYEKSSDTLIVPPQDLQPSEPVDENTSGRITVKTYMPYILTGAGVMLVLGGLIYYWQSGKGARDKPRRRRVSHESRDESATTVYCPQCGTRAKLNDHFCRVCGTRLRKKD